MWSDLAPETPAQLPLGMAPRLILGLPSASKKWAIVYQLSVSHLTVQHIVTA
jgi:hypothetical protein